ncbi:hypothetical protein AGMMS49990_08920 [Endomicrobiia bacterium]|nr:hypothetical protein AGMMS49990_08920 [Endomicrobiia bacterium]
MKEAEERQRDRLSKEEQMISFDFTAMQKAEAEQKARLEERAKIWADYLARYPDVVDYYTRYPTRAQEEADYWYKREQETKRRDEEIARSDEEHVRWREENARSREEREICQGER